MVLCFEESSYSLLSPEPETGRIFALYGDPTSASASRKFSFI
jgi:hypothetical protein